MLETKVLKGETTGSKLICVKKGNQVATPSGDPTTSPCLTLSTHIEPNSQGHCRRWHHEAERSHEVNGQERVKTTYVSVHNNNINCNKPDLFIAMTKVASFDGDV